MAALFIYNLLQNGEVVGEIMTDRPVSLWELQKENPRITGVRLTKVI